MLENALGYFGKIVEMAILIRPEISDQPRYHRRWIEAA